MHAISCDGSMLRRRWRRGKLKSCILSQHTSEGNADAFNDSEYYGTADSVVAHSLSTPTNAEHAASAEAAQNGVPRILLLPGRQMVSLHYTPTAACSKLYMRT
jgi:hypothetical protein